MERIHLMECDVHWHVTEAKPEKIDFAFLAQLKRFDRNKRSATTLRAKVTKSLS